MQIVTKNRVEVGFSEVSDFARHKVEVSSEQTPSLLVINSEFIRRFF